MSKTINLKGKKVFDVIPHTHKTYFSICSLDILLTDGTKLHISPRSNVSMDVETRTGPPPKKKVEPWSIHEKAFVKALSPGDLEEYRAVRKAFFWIIKNREKVRNHYKKPFSVGVSHEERYPERILTIFLPSNVASECDDWFDLGTRNHWDSIIKMYNEVRTP